MDRAARIVAGEGKDMTREDILKLARVVGLRSAVLLHIYDGREGALTDQELAELQRLERFFRLAYESGAAAEREKVAHWMRNCGYATGHGDTVEDLLDHLDTQIAEGLLMERAACADICDQHASIEGIAQRCAAEIRARNK
jgi:hypothetical protein